MRGCCRADFDPTYDFGHMPSDRGRATPSPATALPDVVRELAQHRSFERQSVIFRANAAARHVCFLARGRVMLQRHGARGELVPIHVAQEGEFFAEASLHSERYHCDAVALADSEVALIGVAALRSRLRADPEFAMQWLAVVSRQLRQARARVERLSLKGAAERMRHLLLTEGRGPRPTYALRGSLKELAAELGVTHEALYRTVAAMQREGTIAREGATITLLR